MELIKNIAAIVGCISAVFALLISIIKPVRNAFCNTLARKSEYKHLRKDVTELKDAVANLTNVHADGMTKIETLEEQVRSLSEMMVRNEGDRLRAEIFTCANRCRRGADLYPEEFDRIRAVYHRYHDELKLNSQGTDDYNFIYNYYNSQQFDHVKA